MSVSRRLEARIEYRCDICGRVGIWGEGGWRAYTSILHDETCKPEEIPHACSDDCATELERRVNIGLVALPTLRMSAGGMHVHVTKPGRGYGPFLVPPECKPRRHAKSVSKGGTL